MDYEYDDEPLEGRILWGRIAVYGVAFLLVFLLGSCFGSRSAPSDDELEQLSEQVRSLASENEVLEQQLAAATAGGQTGDSTGTDGGGDGEPVGDGGTEPSSEPTGTPTDGGGQDSGDAGGQMQTYVVKAGDSLYRIAGEFYGDGTKWRLIADENGLDGDNRLTVGQELRIPPAD